MGQPERPAPPELRVLQEQRALMARPGRQVWLEQRALTELPELQVPPEQRERLAQSDPPVPRALDRPAQPEIPERPVRPDRRVQAVL
jgi:hypothetical protein